MVNSFSNVDRVHLYILSQLYYNPQLLYNIVNSLFSKTCYYLFVLVAWSKWHIQVQTSEGTEGLQKEEGQETVTLEIRSPSPTIEEQEKSKDSILQPNKFQVKKGEPRIRSFSNPAMLRRESTEVDMETYDFRRNKITKQAFRFGQYAVSFNWLYYCIVAFLSAYVVISPQEENLRLINSKVRLIARCT